MRMSIDEAKTQLLMQKSYALGRDYKALEIALDTMRKYQKIEKIMAKRPKDMISSNPTLRSISKVLEDGND